MDFKEAYQEDIDQTFFDMEEFASAHVIDGKECEVVLTNLSKTDAKMTCGLMKATINPKETAINKLSYTLYIRDKDMRKKVTTNAVINLDGKNYFVQSVDHADGIYKLIIGGHAV